MKIRKYTVGSMKDAIAKIREELGPDAVILHSRKIARPGEPGNGRPMFEVTAALEEDSSERVMPAWAEQAGTKTGTVGEVFGSLPDLSDRTEDRRSIDFIIDDKKHDEFIPPPADKAKKTGEGRPPGMTRKPDAVPEISMKLSELHQSMLNNEVDDFVAESLVKTALEESRLAKGEDLTTEILPRSLGTFIRCSGPIDTSKCHPKVVALVGPTGVGKTTATAKLAADFAVLERKSVALLAVDVCKAVAVQHLKSYADMVKVPFELALNPAELRRAIKKHSDKDLILIDTGGRSPYKWISILELASFFKGIEEVEIHLVLSAATSAKENLAAVERFGALAVSRLLFTKIDETTDHGSLINIASACKKPISYITTGQNIPDDIEVATCERILQLVSQPGEKRE